MCAVNGIASICFHATFVVGTGFLDSMTMVMLGSYLALRITNLVSRSHATPTAPQKPVVRLCTLLAKIGFVVVVPSITVFQEYFALDFGLSNPMTNLAMMATMGLFCLVGGRILIRDIQNDSGDTQLLPADGAFVIRMIHVSYLLFGLGLGAWLLGELRCSAESLYIMPHGWWHIFMGWAIHLYYQSISFLTMTLVPVTKSTSEWRSKWNSKWSSKQVRELNKAEEDQDLVILAYPSRELPVLVLISRGSSAKTDESLSGSSNDEDGDEETQPQALKFRLSTSSDDVPHHPSNVLDLV
jgi:hypothetical protein